MLAVPLEETCEVADDVGGQLSKVLTNLLQFIDDLELVIFVLLEIEFRDSLDLKSEQHLDVVDSDFAGQLDSQRLQAAQDRLLDIFVSLAIFNPLVDPVLDKELY